MLIIKRVVGPQSKFYVRHIQRCLPVEDLETEEEERNLRTMCETCGNDFPIWYIHFCPEKAAIPISADTNLSVPTENSQSVHMQSLVHTASSHSTSVTYQYTSEEISEEWNEDLSDLPVMQSFKFRKKYLRGALSTDALCLTFSIAKHSIFLF